MVKINIYINFNNWLDLLEELIISPFMYTLLEKNIQGLEEHKDIISIRIEEK